MCSFTSHREKCTLIGIWQIKRIGKQLSLAAKAPESMHQNKCDKWYIYRDTLCLVLYLRQMYLVLLAVSQTKPRWSQYSLLNQQTKQLEKRTADKVPYKNHLSFVQLLSKSCTLRVVKSCMHHVKEMQCSKTLNTAVKYY